MPHLLPPRVGWENERLASFLLSRFSFVAHPSTVADDLGSDFFCTIFNIVKSASNRDVLRPLSSFAIQVKSSQGEVKMDNKIDYLSQLELPFFIGIVSQSPSRMTIYSAESLSLLFALFGLPEKLSLLPIEQSGIDANHIWDDRRSMGRGIRLLCPSVGTFSTEDARSDLIPKVEALHKVCLRAHLNISARKSEEHIYDVDGKGTFQIVAGSGSAMHFRMNFVKRLGEIFHNLDWILGNGPTDSTWTAEFECFESIYKSLEQLEGWSDMPSFVSVPYHALRKKLDQH